MKIPQEGDVVYLTSPLMTNIIETGMPVEVPIGTPCVVELIYLGILFGLQYRLRPRINNPDHLGFQYDLLRMDTRDLVDGEYPFTLEKPTTQKENSNANELVV